MLGEIKHRSKKRGSLGREPKRGKKLNIALNQAEHGLKIGSPGILNSCRSPRPRTSVTISCSPLPAQHNSFSLHFFSKKHPKQNQT